MLWLHGNDSTMRATIFLALAGMLYKYNQCHIILEMLSSACAKLEPASSKNNETLEINIQQKFRLRLHGIGYVQIHYGPDPLCLHGTGSKLEQYGSI